MSQAKSIYSYNLLHVHTHILAPGLPCLYITRLGPWATNTVVYSNFDYTNSVSVHVQCDLQLQACLARGREPGEAGGA